jgi:DUF4097 and DUF4098 domain-containing protein YvlB
VSKIIRYGALISIIALFVFAGCVIADGNFKYRGTRVEVETIDLGGVEVVEFVLGSEDVVIMTEEGRSADFTIEKTFRANEEEYGEELLDGAEILFKRQGDRLIVERKKDKHLGLSQVTKGYVSIDIEVGLPAEMRLNVHTGSGDVEIADREGPVEIDTGSGDVEVGMATAGLDVNTGSGDMKIETARHVVKLDSGSGDIFVGGIGGKGQISTGSGDITVRKVAGDVGVGTGSGDVEINNSVGAVEVGTGSGDVDILHHTGSADINTSSGDVTLGLDGGEGEIVIDTSSGEVDIVMYGGDAYEVDISTGSGSISSRVPLTVRDASRRKLSGRYGEGGFSLTVNTASGSISIMKGAI